MSEPFILQNVKNVMAARLELKALLGVDELSGSSESAILATEEVFSRSYELVEAIEKNITEYHEASPVFQINRAMPNEWITINEDFLQNYLEAARFYDLTGGAFDAGFRGDTSKKFSDRYEIDFLNRRIQRKSRDFTLGFGAIGKGYAVDRISKQLNEELIYPFVINFGGSSQYYSEKVFGTTLANMGWAWEKGRNLISGDEEYVGVDLQPQNKLGRSIGVSGVLEKGGHINLTRQQNVETPLSVFVSGASALECDAFSTALFVLGWEAGYSKKSAMKNRYALALIKQGRVPYWDKEFSEDWSAPFMENAEPN